MGNGRTGWLLLAVIAVAAAWWYRQSVNTPPEQPTIGSIVVVTGGPDPYWESIANGARAAGKVFDVDVRIEAPKEDENVEQQSQILANLKLDGVGGVAISPLDAEGQVAAIDRIAGKSVVVTVDSDAPKSKRDTYIGTHNYSAGQKAAELVHDALPKGGKILVVLANLTKANMLERRDGFEQAINAPQASGAADGPKYKVVDFRVDQGKAKKCRELLTQALKDHPDLAGVVGMNGYHGPLFVDVFTEQDQLGKLALVTFDDEAQTLTGVEAGNIYATVVQDPYLYGYKAVERLVTVCRHLETMRPLVKSKSTFNVSTQLLRKDDVAEYRHQVDERLKATLAAKEN